MTQEIDIKALIRTVPDFPKSGILFRDITTLLKQADGFHAVVEKLGAAYGGRAIDKIAAIESRGFIIGAALAYGLNVGFVPIRKQGKLPAETSVTTTSSTTGPTGWNCTRTGFNAASTCCSSTT